MERLRKIRRLEPVRYNRVVRWDEILARLPEGHCTLVEVGVWQGGTCSRLLAAHPQLHMVLVDPWLAPEPGSTFAESGADQAKFSQARYDAAHAATLRRVKPFEERCTVLRTVGRLGALVAQSRAAEAHLGPIDAVFIDSDHSYEGVKEDIEAWAPLVRPGGWIGGHDYGLPGDKGRGPGKYPGVARAVHEAFGVESVTRGEDRTWFVKL